MSRADDDPRSSLYALGSLVDNSLSAWGGHEGERSANEPPSQRHVRHQVYEQTRVSGASGSFLAGEIPFSEEPRWRMYGTSVCQVDYSQVTLPRLPEKHSLVVLV